MRILSILLLFKLAFAASAQPGPPRMPPGPCLSGIFSMPLQDVRRHDVQVVSTSMGTDDVPSSSGNCIQQVVLREHADFLLERDRQGYHVIYAAKEGEVLHPDSLKAGLAADRFRWGKSSMPICYQGYGSQFDGKGWHLMEPRTWERSIVRLTTEDAVYLVAMTVTYREPGGTIEVRGRRVLQEGEPLPIH